VVPRKLFFPPGQEKELGSGGEKETFAENREKKHDASKEKGGSRCLLTSKEVSLTVRQKGRYIRGGPEEEVRWTDSRVAKNSSPRRSRREKRAVPTPSLILGGGLFPV